MRPPSEPPRSSRRRVRRASSSLRTPTSSRSSRPSSRPGHHPRGPVVAAPGARAARRRPAPGGAPAGGLNTRRSSTGGLLWTTRWNCPRRGAQSRGDARGGTRVRDPSRGARPGHSTGSGRWRVRPPETKRERGDAHPAMPRRVAVLLDGRPRRLIRDVGGRGRAPEGVRTAAEVHERRGVRHLAPALHDLAPRVARAAVGSDPDAQPVEIRPDQGQSPLTRATPAMEPAGAPPDPPRGAGERARERDSHGRHQQRRQLQHSLGSA